MDESERQELISRLFALLTAKLEDAAALAAEGQGRSVNLAAATGVATRLTEAAQEVQTIAEAVIGIASTASSGTA